jgi:hypothetical protein
MYLKTSMYQLSFDGHKFPFTGWASTVFPICDHRPVVSVSALSDMVYYIYLLLKFIVPK